MSVTPRIISVQIKARLNCFLNAGIPISAIIMNLVVLSSVMSSMNSGVFGNEPYVVWFVKKRWSRHRVFRDVYQNVLYRPNGLIFSCIFIMGGRVASVLCSKHNGSIYFGKFVLV
ncbi:hypothetical protein ABVN80_18475 [Acinetobacter baumannii]